MTAKLTFFPSMLLGCRGNIESNAGIFGSTAVHAELLEWSNEGMKKWLKTTAMRQQIEKFDFIICSDCIYHENLYTPLSSCIHFLADMTFTTDEGGADAPERASFSCYCDIISECECWLMCPDRNNGHERFLKVAATKFVFPKRSAQWAVPEELQASFADKVERTKQFAEKAYPHFIVMEKE